jgi:radical SAM superfamily enzyme YgiQ (UPF0313 family)
MKIVLINASSSEFINPGILRDQGYRHPLGLLYLGAMIKKDHDVFIWDYAADSPALRERTVKRLESIGPDVVGISTTLDITLHSTKEIARKAREICPGAAIILGGITAFFLKDTLINEPYVDMIVPGEGEISFKKCIQYLDKDTDAVKDPADVPGILYKRGGKIVETPPPGFIDNLDSLPFPAFDLMKEEIGGDLPLSSSRGCGMGCIYCASTAFWGKWRPRSPGNVAREIDTLVDTYGVHRFHFVDDNFGFDPGRIREFCRLIEKRKLNIEWGGSFRPDFLDRELLPVMRQNGCRAIFFGVESGSERILKRIKRHYTPQQVEDLVNDCIAAGIIPTASFIIGLPGEKTEDVERTFRLMKRLNTPELELAMIYPLYGTAVYDRPGEFGYEILEHRRENRSPNLRKSMVNTDTFSAGELESLYYKGLGIIKRKSHKKHMFLKKVLKEDAHAFQ